MRLSSQKHSLLHDLVKHYIPILGKHLIVAIIKLASHLSDHRLSSQPVMNLRKFGGLRAFNNSTIDFVDQTSAVTY
jgi:hypothetical protein